MGSKLFVGIDLGGTRCRIIIADNLERIDNVRRDEFILSHDFDADMASLIRIIQAQAAGQQITAIGMGVPGDLNPEKTFFVDPSVNLTEWSHRPVKAMLEREFHCPVLLENDVTVAARGEANFGSGKGKDFTFVIWGTGVGGAKVEQINGQAVYSDLDWRRYFEIWELACGGNGIRELYGKEASQLTEHEWQQVMNEFEKQLTVFIETTGPRLVIFGGGIASKQRERLLEAVATSQADTQVSKLGEDAGLYGALALSSHQARQLRNRFF